MEKVLPTENEVFLIESRNGIELWNQFEDEILELANRGLSITDDCVIAEGQYYKSLSKWLDRYLNEGITDKFLDDLNKLIHNIQYSKYVIPLDLVQSENGFPCNAYAAQYRSDIEPIALAADDFSKLLTSGKLCKLKKCQLNSCGRYFMGRPQSKWCSKTCGSHYRVSKKRKRDQCS